MSHSFYGGVHPAAKKLTYDRPIKRVFIPKRVVLPVIQHTGVPAEPIVAVGDNVKAGSVVGKAAGHISSAVHASISGKVTRVSYGPTPTLPRVLSITIEAQEADDQELAFTYRQNAETLATEELLAIVRDAGIVGLGGAAFPTHVKLAPPKAKLIDTLIINGAECEPYLTCDHRLMVERPKDIIKGADLIAKILDVKDVLIGIEDNKLAAIYALERLLREIADRRKKDAPKIRVVTVRTKYPQGSEKQLIRALTNRVVPAGALPMDVGCVVQNVGTVIAIYEAAYLGKPLIERVVTVTGSCLKEPVNMTVRIGTLLSDVALACGGFIKEPRKIVVGGPMMGISQYTQEVPIIKGTGGILFLSADELDRSAESVCIRCGKCVEICPMGLVPTTLMQHVKKEQFGEAKERGIVHCFECGACAYECPAKIPLLDYMKYGKAKS